MKTPKLSIIIVAYKAQKELFDCLDSVEKSVLKISHEVIIVDNNEKSIEKDLRKTFPWIRYVKSQENKGFGAGGNMGAKAAKGELLFFLSPDTLVNKDAIALLVEFIEKRTDIAVMAPLSIKENKTAYKIQGSKELTPLRAIFCLSFLNTLFPNNFVSKEYFLSTWDKKQLIEADAVPGSAFLIKKEVFKKVEGFDERFFMYFEEHDLGNRIKKLGYKLYMYPEAKIVHLGGRSSKENKNLVKIFSQSRFLYVKKHYGLLSALLVETFLSIKRPKI